MSLVHKFALFALVFTLFLISQWFISIYRERSILMEEAQERALVLVRTMAELAREPMASGRLGYLESHIRSFMGERDAAYAMILDEKSRIIAASEPGIVGWSLSEAKEQLVPFLWTQKSLIARAAIQIPGSKDGYAELGFSRATLDTKIKNGMYLFARFLAVELLLLSFFLVLIYRQLMVPVRVLVYRLDKADPDSRIHPLGLPRGTAMEIKRIAKAVDNLRSREAVYQGKLIAEERLATVGRMAADVAHEIRNPLEAILGAVELLSSYESPNNDFLAVIQEEARNLNQYLTNVLESARTGSTAPSATDLAIIAKEASMLAGSQAHDAGIRIELCLSPCPCMAVHAALKRAVLNLLLNAIQASDPESNIIVVSGIVDSKPTLQIRDHGEGLEDGMAEHLFEPFVTTKNTGTGLGLSLARQVVEDHGGQLTIRSSEDNEGVVATIMLPSSGV